MLRSRLPFVFWVTEVIALIGLLGGINLDTEILFYGFWLAVAAVLVLSFALRKDDPTLAKLGFATSAFALFYGFIGFGITR